MLDTEMKPGLFLEYGILRAVNACRRGVFKIYISVFEHTKGDRNDKGRWEEISKKTTANS